VPDDAVAADGRTVVCLDADVLIYASSTRHSVGGRVRRLFGETDTYRLVGSTLLLPEALTRPYDTAEATELEKLTARLELWPITEDVGRLAVWVGATYRLDPMDATHLACAVDGGADVFLTNNRKDFDAARIGAIDIVYPDELPAPTRSRR
jgi:predicted nucleic acid-binding protein